MIDYQVYLVRFPGSVKGAVRIDECGFASIYINDALGPSERRAVFRHELRHLYHLDHYNNNHIREIERRAKGKKTTRNTKERRALSMQV